MLASCGMDTIEIALADITVSSFNTRKDMVAGTEDTKLTDLVDSIREHGLINPVMVMDRDDGGYDLIAGQRRFRACQQLGRATITAIVRNDLDPTDATVLSLVENVHRADMNPIDKARAYWAIFEKFPDYNEVARQTAVSVKTVRRYLSLLDLDEAIQEQVSTFEGPAGVGTLEQVARTFDPEDQQEVLDHVGGFNQRVQKAIIRESRGDPEQIKPLSEAAMEGAFDVRMCSEGLCPIMPDWMKRQVREQVAGLPTQ